MKNKRKNIVSLPSKKEKPAHIQAHLQSRTNRPANQSYAKELAFY